MSQFEDFVNLELPRRSALLTVEITGYDGDPNDGGAPAIITGSPKGTWYLRGDDVFWRKNAAGTWEEGGGGGGGGDIPYPVTTANLAVTVDGVTGSDTPTGNRPEFLAGGDYSAYPYETIQAAIDALPQIIRHAVTVTVTEAGDYAGFNIKGYNVGAGSLRVTGLQEQVTPASGPATGTATGGAAKSLTLAAAGWTADDFQGKFCRIISGTGAGQHFIIATNTTDTLTFAAPMSPAPDATSVFEITEPVTRLTTPESSFYAGVYVTGCIGISITVEDFHIVGNAGLGLYYGLVQAWTQSNLNVYRVTVETCYYSFSGQESLKASWRQVGSLGSFYHGFAMLAVQFFGNLGFEKGWLALNAGGGFDGVWISDCGTGGINGVYVDGCGNNGIGFYNTQGGFQNVVANNNADGVWVSGSKLSINNLEAGGNSGRGVGSTFGGRVDLSGSISGSGNGTWGVDMSPGVGGLATLTSLPTITGTNGDATVDGTNVLVWATDFAAANDYASFPARQAQIVRA